MKSLGGLATAAERPIRLGRKNPIYGAYTICTAIYLSCVWIGLTQSWAEMTQRDRRPVQDAPGAGDDGEVRPRIAVPSCVTTLTPRVRITMLDSVWPLCCRKKTGLVFAQKVEKRYAKHLSTGGEGTTKIRALGQPWRICYARVNRMDRDRHDTFTV